MIRCLLLRPSFVANMSKIRVFVFISIQVILLMTGSAAGNCDECFLSCTCEYDQFTMKGPEVECNRVPVSTVKIIFNEVQTRFIEKFILTPNINDKGIIANVIGNHLIDSLVLTCPLRSSSLIVDPAAFSFTKNFTSSLAIKGCDLNQLNWAFLSGFSKLSSLSISNSANLHSNFSTLPSTTLTRLSSLSLFSIMGLNGFNNASLKFPASLPNGLSSLYVGSCYDLNDVAMQNFLSKWVTPTSTKKLVFLNVVASRLSNIPKEVSKYTKLTTAGFFGNLAPMTFKKGAFNFSDPVEAFNNDFSQINSIEDGAFIGDFSDAFVTFYRNNLTTLNRGAFETMLKQMSESYGYLEIGANPIDCSLKNQCNLAWLIRDNPSYLDAVWSAQCSNGTLLIDLNGDLLKTPKGAPCP